MMSVPVVVPAVAAGTAAADTGGAGLVFVAVDIVPVALVGGTRREMLEVDRAVGPGVGLRGTMRRGSWTWSAGGCTRRRIEMWVREGGRLGRWDGVVTSSHCMSCFRRR